ncbi:MAG: immunoglobulin domain-containing protein [Lacunisphaera sp.]
MRLLTSSGDPVVVGGSPWLEGHEDGRGAAARFGMAGALAIDTQDNLYLIDDAGAAIRKGQFVGFAPTITTQPVGGAFAASSTVTLSVAASGTPAPTYQWYRDGVSLPGSTDSTLKIASLGGGSTGSYTVNVTNPAGSVLSAAAVVTLASPPPPPTGGGSGSSGGGGAPSSWFLATLLALAAIRKFRRGSNDNSMRSRRDAEPKPWRPSRPSVQPD